MLNNLKKLVVCGDSFNSVSNQYKQNTTETYQGTHWSEVISQRLDCDLINLSCPASSNTVIVIQILEAIELRPDLIIVGWSAGHGTRIEYVTNGEEPVPASTLGDFKYLHRNHPYEKLNKRYNQVVESSSLIDMPDKKLADQLAMVLPFNLMGRRDTWLIMYAVSKLVKSKIPFLVFERPPSWPADWPSPFTDELLEYCTRENIILRTDFNPQPLHDHDPAKNHPCYHTSIESQILIADYLEQRIKDYIS
jgi:hypothetical protein